MDYNKRLGLEQTKTDYILDKLTNNKVFDFLYNNDKKITKGIATAGLAALLTTLPSCFTIRHAYQSWFPSKSVNSLTGRKESSEPSDSFLEALGKDTLIFGGAAALKGAVDKSSSDSEDEWSTGGPTEN